MRIATMPSTSPTRIDPTRDHCRGPIDAPFQLLEYGDFAERGCQRAFQCVMALRREFGDRLCFAFRYLPLATYVPALHAAHAAEAAAAQGQFWAMHDLLFEHQDALEDPDLVRHSTRLRLDADRLLHEVETGVYHDRITEDVSLADRAEVKSVPVFLINGRRYRGPLTFESLRDAITSAAA